jgi:hypothetical protein
MLVEAKPDHKCEHGGAEPTVVEAKVNAVLWREQCTEAGFGCVHDVAHGFARSLCISVAITI